MSLTNIQLPATVIEELYRNVLTETITNPAATEKKQPVSLNILGKNRKNIVVLVNNAEAAYLPDDELNFLLGILSACRLTMEDVGIINIRKNKNVTYSRIATELNTAKVFLFGVEPGEIDMPLSFPYYQVQAYNNQTLLSAPKLADLKDDKAEKGKLWNSLKTIFSI